LPALANRREDLPLLEKHFLGHFSSEYSKPIAGLTRRAQTRLSAYHWPGNIRELENVIGNACMMTDGNSIDIADLPERFRTQSNENLTADETFLPLEEIERRHVLRVLKAVGDNKVRAAEVLKIGRATIYQILSRMKIAE
jgi:DNA-binding NtrC family response regulator